MPLQRGRDADFSFDVEEILKLGSVGLHRKRILAVPSPLLLVSLWVFFLRWVIVFGPGWPPTLRFK